MNLVSSLATLHLLVPWIQVTKIQPVDHEKKSYIHTPRPDTYDFQWMIIHLFLICQLGGEYYNVLEDGGIIKWKDPVILLIWNPWLDLTEWYIHFIFVKLPDLIFICYSK